MENDDVTVPPRSPFPGVPAMTAPLLVMSNVIVDSIVLADGSECPPVAGGAGVYAAAGAGAWWAPVALLAGVGQDFDEVTQGIAEAYDFARDGLVFRDPHCIRSKLVYSADGSRTERPAFGAAHFAKLQVDCSDLPDSLPPAAGTYIFQGGDDEFWQSYFANRARLGTVLWEIDQDLALSAALARFSAVAGIVDIVSMNVAEAGLLLGELPPIAAIAKLHRLGARNIVLRMGARGAIVSDGIAAFAVRPPVSAVVDVTGGGNAFNGGFLAGWCQKAGLEHAARCAAASAAVAIAQPGPPAPPAAEVLSWLAAGTTIEPITI